MEIYKVIRPEEIRKANEALKSDQQMEEINNWLKWIEKDLVNKGNFGVALTDDDINSSLWKTIMTTFREAGYVVNFSSNSLESVRGFRHSLKITL